MNISEGLSRVEAEHTITPERLFVVHMNAVLPVNEMTVCINICAIAVLPNH
jgi:hypothetical protein